MALPASSPGGTYAPGAQADTVGTRLKAAYAKMLDFLGVHDLPYDDPRVLMLYQAIGQLGPDAALKASQARASNPAMDDYSFDHLIDATRGDTQPESESDPTIGFGKAINSAYMDQRRLYGSPADNPDVGNFAANDPRNIKLIQDIGQQTGVNFTPDQATQLGQLGAQWKRATGTGIPEDAVDWFAGQVTNRRILQPHQMNPAAWDAMGPMGQQLYLSAASAKGYDPTDYQQKINAARPVGTAPRTSRVDYAQNLAGVY